MKTVDLAKQSIVASSHLSAVKETQSRRKRNLGFPGFANPRLKDARSKP